MKIENDHIELINEIKSLRKSSRELYKNGVYKKAHGLAESHSILAKTYFVEGLQDNFWDWRENCLIFLGYHYGKLEPEIIQKIERIAINDPEFSVRITALSVLFHQINEINATILFSLNNDNDYFVRKFILSLILNVSGVSQNIIDKETNIVETGEILITSDYVKKILIRENKYSGIFD